jgi:hypothetical protein
MNNSTEQSLLKRLCLLIHPNSQGLMKPEAHKSHVNQVIINPNFCKKYTNVILQPMPKYSRKYFPVSCI